jgi:serine/threonine-protein kinase RsbW
VNGTCELRLNRTACLASPRPLRHALGAFLVALELDEDLRTDIVTAVGETLANAVEHAYARDEPGPVELYARRDEDLGVVVDVFDRGNFLDRTGGSPGRGRGLRIVRAIARSVTIDTAEGTHVRMVFDATPRHELTAPQHRR